MEELKPSQLLAIGHLAAGLTVEATAKKIDVNIRTIFRWLRDPSFKAELRRVVTVNYHNHLNQLQGLLGRSIERLRDILENEESQPSDIIRVASLLLSACDRYQEAHLVERIEKLELDLQNEQS